MFYLAVGIIAFVIMALASIFSKFNPRDEELKKTKDKRKNAIDNLETIRQRVQKKQGKFIDVSAPPPDDILQQLKDESNDNAKKMADTLKKIID